MEKKGNTYDEQDPVRTLAPAHVAASRKSCEGKEAIQWAESGLIAVDRPVQQASSREPETWPYWSEFGSDDGSKMPSPVYTTLPEQGQQPKDKPRHYKVWLWIALLLVVLVVLVVVITVPIVTHKKSHSPLEASKATTSTSASMASTSTSTTSTTTTSVPPAGPTLPIASPLADAFNIGTSYKSTFTYYGSGDMGGSENCNTVRNACGFYSNPGYTAAISEALFGAAPGAGPGPACGTCWKLDAKFDSSGNGLKNGSTSIVVMANNICPALGNPICGQRNLGLTNQYGANVNVNLCIDSGASKALFGSSGVGLAVGTATRVDCSLWKGKRIP